MSNKKNSAYIIYTDGGSRGNPGQAAYGFVIYDTDKNVIYERGQRLGIATNNVAEYMGILSALEWVKNNDANPTEINVYMDSQLAVMQLSRIYKIKNPTLKGLFDKIQGLSNELSCPISYTHIPREENKAADRMVNYALDNDSLA